MQTVRLLGFLAFFSILCGCTNDRSEGLITTRDGRLVSGTADVVTSELAYKWANRAADAAGDSAEKKWKATLEIAGEPEFELVHEGEWGWRHMPLTLTLAPPAGAMLDPATRTSVAARTEAALRSVAIFRVRNPDDITCTTTILDAQQPLPGSQTYTVVKGDTWTGIADAFYGTTQNWRQIADANPATELTPGTTITIPPK